MKIGSVKIESPVFLAPMAGVTDYAFRILCKEMGAGVVYSEFVSADGIIRENQKTLDLIHFHEEERPIGIQMFGSSPEVMAQAARFVVDNFRPDILDINYGCPVPKVTKRGAGSAALKDLCLMDEITASVVESVPDVPVTVKMRSGWNKESIVTPEAGERLEKIGIKAITLHPRTTVQSYLGQADWSLIKELKQTVSIPGALGNPWFFRETLALLKGEPLPEKCTVSERVEMCQRHFDLLLENRGEHWGMNLMRKHFGWYIRGFPGAAKFRQALVTAQGLDEMQQELISLSKTEQRASPPVFA